MVAALILNQKESLGLRNMQHCTKLLGGNIKWHHGKEKGTVILIKIPVQV